MRNLRLRAVEDEEYGGLGLKFVIPHKFCSGKFTIQSGLLLAHDLIEHQQGTKKIGSIGDEMVALGGICYARGQWGTLTKGGSDYYSPAENIASDLYGQMAGLYFEGGIPFRQKLVKSRDEDPSDFVDDVIEAARENWDKFYESWDYDTDELKQSQIDCYLEDCRTFMLHGSKLAARRFGSGTLANDLFWEIERQTDGLISDIEFEGQEFTLAYDFKLNVNFKEVTDAGYY